MRALAPSSLSLQPRPQNWACIALLAVLISCSSADAPPPVDDSGAPGSGGSVASGGNLGSSGGAASASGGTGGTGTGGVVAQSGGTSGGTGGAVASGPAHVVVVAHQDDDLLFINPDLKRAIDAGEPLATAYLTSGNAGEGMAYVAERELGIKSAYAFMAGVSNSWSCAPQAYAGKMIETCQLVGAEVQLIFFRLVDGFADGSFAGSLQSLWRGEVSPSTAVDGSGLSFTRQALLDALVAIFQQIGATEIYTTDFSFEHRQNDHSDHENAGLFTVAASALHSLPHSLHSYITYTTKDEPPNLSAEDAAMVSDTFAHYASCDKFIEGCSGGAGCDQAMCTTSSVLYSSWFSRHYSFSRKTAPRSGMIQSAHFAGGCLVADGSNVTLGSCATATAWTWGLDYTLKTPDGQCLSSPAANSPRTASIRACDQGDHQKWFVMDNAQIILGAQPAPGESAFQLAQCLDAGTQPGSPIVVMDCGTDPALDWTF